MSRHRAHVAEVVGRIDNAAPEMVMPDAVHNTSPSQDVVRIGEPASQSGAAAAFVVWIRELESRRKAGHARQGAGIGRLSRIADVTAAEHVDRAWMDRWLETTVGFEFVCPSIDELLRGQGSNFFFELGQ